MPSRKRRSTTKKKKVEEEVEEKVEETTLAQEESENEEEEEEEVSKPQKKKAKVASSKSTKKGSKTKTSVSSTQKKNTRSVKSKKNAAKKNEEEEGEEEEMEVEKPKTRSSTRRKSATKKEVIEEEEEMEVEKPKTRSSTRRKSATKKEVEEEEEEEEEEMEVEKPKTRSSTRRKSATKKEVVEEEEEMEVEKPKTRSSTRRKSATKKEAEEEEEDNDEDNKEEENEEGEEEEEETPSGRPRRRAAKTIWKEDPESSDSDEYYDDDDEDYDNNIEDITNDSPFVGHKGKKRSFFKKTRSEEVASSDEDDDEEDEVNEDGEKVPKLHLLARISKGGRDTRYIKEWAEKYKAYPVAAVADLVNLVIESCGWPYRITSKKLASGDVEKILESLVSSSWVKNVKKKMQMKKGAQKGKSGKGADDPENAGTYGEEVEDGLEENGDNDEVVNSAVLNNKKSREHFLGFWDKIIQISKDGFLYDDYLLPVLVSWINSLTNSTTRSFRRTATSVALQIAHSLIKVIQELNSVLEKNSRQQDSEKKRNSGRTTSKLMDLEDQAKEIKGNTKTIGDTVKSICTNVIGLRFRDVVPAIRAECIAKVADFIVLWPKELLVNAYLKYLGWGLSDKVASVRLEAVRAIAAVYRGNERNNVLDNFWARFKKRINEMLCDVDVQVAVETVNLLKVAAPTYFKDEDFEELFKFISSDVPEVRRALGSFVIATAFSQPKDGKDSDNESDDSKLSKKESSGMEDDDENKEEEEEEDDDEKKILRVIEIVNNYSGLPSMPCYVADALWNNSDGNNNGKVIQYWKVMTSMLLRNSDSTSSSSSSSVADDELNAESLSEVEQRTLAGILSASCKLAAGIPITQTTRGPAPSGKEGEQLRVQQDAMTAEVASELPLLLEKYGAEENIVEDLLEIIPALSLPAISALRLEHAFTDILAQVCKIFAKSVNDDVLQAAATGLSYMISGTEGPHKQSSEAATAASTLVESIISSDDTGDLVNNEVAMKRILILYQQVDLHENKLLQESVISKAKGILDTQCCDKNDVLCTSMKLVCQDILWKFSCVSIESVDDIQDIMDVVEDICTERDAFVTNLGTILVQKSIGNEVRDLAYNIVADIATVFTPSLGTTLYRKFAYSLPEEICLVLREYFLENVYDAMRKKSCDYPGTKDGEDAGMEVESDDTANYEDVTKRIVSVAMAYAKICCSGALGSAYCSNLISLYHLYLDSEPVPSTKKSTASGKSEKKDSAAASTQKKKKKKASNKRRRKDDDDEDDEEDEMDDEENEEEENGTNISENEEETKCLVKCQQELDNIAKAVLRKIREHDKSKEWETVAFALQCCYSEFIESEKDPENLGSAYKRHFNDVSKWLSFSYGPVPFGELRVSLLRVVQESVLWALDKDPKKRVGILAPPGIAYFASKFAASEAQFIRDQIEKKAAENGDISELEGFRQFNKVLDKALKKGGSGTNDVRKNLEKELENEN